MVKKASSEGRIAAFNYIGELQRRTLISSKGVCWIELSGVERVECGNGEEAILCCDIIVNIVPV